MRRRLVLLLLTTLWPATTLAQSVLLSQYPPGQKATASSLPVVIASDQSAVAISAGSLPLPTGAATEATLGGLLTDSQTQTTALQLIDNLVLAEDGVHSSGEAGVLSLVVRFDAGGALGADGDRVPLQVDSAGALRVTGGGGGTQYTEGDTDATITGTAILWEGAANTLTTVASGTPLPVTCATCSGTGVQHIDDAVFTATSDDVVPLGALFDATPPSITDGRVGVVRMNSARELVVEVGTFPDNEPFNLQQVLGSTHSATNPLFTRLTDGTTAITPAQLDLDSGGGTVSRVAFGLAAAASGGPVAIEGTTANGLEVDVTRVQGTVTVDTELPTATTPADNTAAFSMPAVAAYLMCEDSGGLFDPCLASALTEATQDGALTVASIVGNVPMYRASSTEPTNVSANDDAVAAWGLPSGAAVATLVDFTGDSVMDNTNNAVNVAIVAGAAAGGTSSNFGSAFPGPGTAAGFNDGTNMQGARVVDLDTSGGNFYGLAINLVRRVSGTPMEHIGQTTMANSLPVVLASDHSAITIATSVTGGASGVLSVGGNVAHDAAVTANPLLMGGYASASAPADVSADGDAVRAWFRRNGQQVVQVAYAGTLATVNNGAADGGTQRVTIANDSTGVLASISTSITPGTAAANLGKPVDGVAGATDTGVLLLAVRDDALTTLTPADGDYTQLRVNSTGALHVTGAGGGTQYVEDDAGAATPTVTLAGAIRQDTLASSTSTDGDVANLKVNASGALYVTGGGGGTEYTVNAAAPADPTGATFVMERDDAISALTEVEGDWTNPRSNANGALWVAHDPSVTLVANVTQWGSTNVVTGGVSGSVGVGGLAAHDAAVSGNPLLLGVEAKDQDGAALPNAVSAEGDAVRLAASLSGVLYVMPVNEDGSAVSTVTIGTFPDNEPFNVAQINGVAPLMGAGNTGTGSLRVTIATDQAALTGLGVYVEDAGETAGGNLVMVGGVRRDVAASSAGTSGDNATLNTDTLGLLWTRSLDPCDGVAKTYLPIDIVTATTTEITAALAGASTHYYVCSVNLVTAGANNVALALAESARDAHGEQFRLLVNDVGSGRVRHHDLEQGALRRDDSSTWGFDADVDRGRRLAAEREYRRDEHQRVLHRGLHRHGSELGDEPHHDQSRDERGMVWEHGEFHARWHRRHAGRGERYVVQRVGLAPQRGFAVTQRRERNAAAHHP